MNENLIGVLYLIGIMITIFGLLVWDASVSDRGDNSFENKSRALIAGVAWPALLFVLVLSPLYFLPVWLAEKVQQRN